MDETIRGLWDRLFGTAWEKLSQSVTDVSAFILDDVNKAVYTDKNAGGVLGYSRQPSYKELSLLISDCGDGAKSFRVIIAEQNSSCTAGFIHKVSSDSGIYSGLPICSYAELVSAVSEGRGCSLLALIQLERTDIPEMPESGVPEAVEALKKALPEGALIAAAEKKRLWIYIGDCGSEDKAALLQGVQKKLSDSLPGVTFTAGGAIDDGAASQRMKTAEITLFDIMQKGRGGIELYSDEQYERRKAEFDSVKRFMKLIDENLFVYNFQPIVSAETGNIIAYEALMRTDNSINMFPLEILGAAAKLGKLYEIEKATMRNTLRYISRHQAAFKGKKLFINSIPAYMLTQSDWNALMQEYGELMEKLVIEMTEQTEINDERLAAIQDRLSQSNIRLAIDDYGTGYSNTANLLRYKPRVIKIDRSLVADIDTKPMTQRLVSGLIDFCHENGIEVLTEGVETRNELKTVIKLGVDLIQGYYTSRPKSFAIEEISAEIRKEIAEFSVMYSRRSAKVFRPVDGERIDLDELTLQRYSAIFVDVENVIIEGKKDKKFQITVNVDDGVKTNITMRDACIVNDKIAPCFALGANCDVTLRTAGESACFGKHGILVPATSFLRITGGGALTVVSEEISGYGIGTDKDHSPGNITVDGTVKLTVRANGEYTVAIGGGKNEGGTSVQILGGEVSVKCSGAHCIGIGNFDGDSRIKVENCKCLIDMSSPDSVAIGSHEGKTDIEAAFVFVDIVMSGENLCGIGTMTGGEGSVYLHDASIKCNMHGSVIRCIGTRGGSLNCSVAASSVTLECEGNNVTGIGDADGSGCVTLSESDIGVFFGAKESVGIAAKPEKITENKCKMNIHINE